MSETDRLTRDTGWVDLSVVERERTPPEIIEKAIRHHLAELSLSNTVDLLEDFGVKRSRTAIHNWVQKAGIVPASGLSPDRVALDQTVIRVNGEQYWLYAAVDPETNRFLHVRLFPTYTIPITREFLSELLEKHDVADALFLVDSTRDLEGALRRMGLTYRLERHGWRYKIERVFLEIERRTSSFSNSFSHTEPATANTWLQAFAVWWNQCQS